jgi:hypothetical protein
MLFGVFLGRTLYCNTSARGKEYVLRAITYYLENLLLSLRRGDLPEPSLLSTVTAVTRKAMSRKIRTLQAPLDHLEVPVATASTTPIIHPTQTTLVTIFPQGTARAMAEPYVDCYFRRQFSNHFESCCAC